MAVKGIIALVLLALIGYGLLEARHLIAGPSITLDSPSDYTAFADGFVPVNGVANNTKNLTLNGDLLPIDEAGRFANTLLLPQGGGILSLTATDRFGRSVTVRRMIYVP